MWNQIFINKASSRKIFIKLKISTRLLQLLINNIQKVLPELKERIDKLKAGCDDFLNDCGEEITNPTKTVIKIADDFSEKYCSMIKGNSEELKTDTL